MADLLTEPKEFRAFAPKWEPLFWNLADYTPEQLLNSGAPWMQMLSVLRVERAEAEAFHRVFTEAAKRLAELQGREEVRWHDCLRVILTYASWRRPPGEAKELEDIVLKTNPRRKKDVRKMIQSIADDLMEKGRAEGALQTHRDNLRDLLLRKFRKLPKKILQRIETCTDIERLKTALGRVLDWKSVDEFDL